MAEVYNQVNKKESEVTGVSIRLASPETIKNWSYGEVKKPETINYRSFKPEKDGLFCEKIFGPVKNWECNCGKYKRIRYRGVVCDRCGVEVTHSRVRRQRLGHIDLAVPIIHIWFFRNNPSYISNLLGMTASSVEKIIYYDSYVVIDPGNTGLGQKELIKEEEYDELEAEGKELVAKMGGEAVLDLLAEIDLDDLSAELRYKISIETSAQRKKEHYKRLQVVEQFRKGKNNPENMVLRVLPVLPPDLRPLVPLEGGRFATSDLNDLYRRVINRNNRLKKLIEIKAPEVILRNEMRMLQEAVDTLFDNGKRNNAVLGSGKRPLKSLSDLLKGKQGRFRQNLLGKRVDYSGRSVIVVGPELKLYQCGLPKMMALELFKPFVIQKLQDRGIVQTVKSAKRYVEKADIDVWDVLEEVIEDHPVMLNRAPTLHRLGIQAFFPKLVEGKAIRLHPLVCAAFNADFDGDQMAIHVPLSYESQLECRLLMLSANNLLRPSNGEPVVGPSQDIVLGIYYLTKIPNNKDRENLMLFSDIAEVEHGLENGCVTFHDRIIYNSIKGKIETSPGRVIFNSIIPEQFQFVNKLMKKTDLNRLVGKIVEESSHESAIKFLDDMKNLGYEYSTVSGTTFGIDDLVVPEEKEKTVNKSISMVDKIRKQYRRGIITEGERYNKIIDIWTHTTNEVSSALHDKLKADKDGFNPVFMMLDAKARGSQDQIKQLAGMRGLMQKPQKNITGGVGEIIENPITSNFKEGLTGIEYFISTHGARKGLADTALKTADAGYLTRRLVDVAQDVIITEDDCGTIRSMDIEPLREGDEIIEPLTQRIVGRVTSEDVVHPVSGDLLCATGDMISPKLAEEIENAGVECVSVRSVLTCDCLKGVCRKCYGRNAATGEMVYVGDAVGTMAAQSIGEPGTQLTLRTFHIGGTASRMIAKSEENAPVDGSVKYYVYDGNDYINEVDTVDYNEEAIVLSRNAEAVVFDSKENEYARYKVPHGSVINKKDGDKVKKGDSLFSWDPYNSAVVSKYSGNVKLVDITPGKTLREEYDPETKMTSYLIVEDKTRKLHPHIYIEDPETGDRLANVTVPVGAYIQHKDGDKITAGEALFKVPRESGKSKDITGGLPRVAELFEARKPKNSAIISELDGIVEFKTKPVKDENGKVIKDRKGNELREPDIERGNRKIIIRDDDQEKTKTYMVPVGKHMRVHDGDRVNLGDRLSEGAIDPHDILHVLGEDVVVKHLIDEIQAVYRLQGVSIDDKHIETIVSQMLRKVRINEPGDTDFLAGQMVDKRKLKLINTNLINDGNEPATFTPILLGITKASVNTESFLSAASFQETTKVLSRAAVEGKIDDLASLKENIVMGNIIPAGTGVKDYKEIKVKDIETSVGEAEAEDIGPDFEAL